MALLALTDREFGNISVMLTLAIKRQGVGAYTPTQIMHDLLGALDSAFEDVCGQYTKIAEKEHGTPGKIPAMRKQGKTNPKMRAKRLTKRLRYQLGDAKFLKEFTKRVVYLGGSWIGRYPHVNRTKWFICRNVEAFEQAAREAGMEYEVIWLRGHPHFYLEGITLIGTRSKQ